MSIHFTIVGCQFGLGVIVGPQPMVRFMLTWVLVTLVFGEDKPTG